MAYEGGRPQGYLRPQDALGLALEADPGQPVAAYLARDFVLVGERRRLFNLVPTMRRHGAAAALVLGGTNGGVVGVVSAAELGRLTLDVSELYV
ncbi:hypothetical protein [Oceanithermus profundus]